MQSPQQHRRPRVIIAAAVAALVGLCLCVAAISLLLPHESARILRGGSPVLVLGDETPPPTRTRLPTATIAPTKTPPPSPLDTPTPASPPDPTATLAPSTADLPADAISAELTRVVDGDTIVVITGGVTETVRYIGVDTPERGQPGYTAATEANATLLDAGALLLVPDISKRDRWGRLLRYVYLADGRMVNSEMVAQGWAQPVEYPPDTLHASELRILAREAADARRGFWNGAGSDGAMPYALTTTNADIRAGPGAGFEINMTVPQGTPLTVFSRTHFGDWLQVRTPDRSGGWIEAHMVRLNVPAAQVPVPRDLPPTLLAPTTAHGPVQIVQLNGAARDETVVIDNLGDEPVDLSGWSIQSYGGGACQPMAEQVYTFPAGLELAASASVRIHSGPGAFSDPPGDLLWTVENIWNNSGDRADLRDGRGLVANTWAYGTCR